MSRIELFILFMTLQTELTGFIDQQERPVLGMSIMTLTTVIDRRLMGNAVLPIPGNVLMAGQADDALFLQQQIVLLRFMALVTDIAVQQLNGIMLDLTPGQLFGDRPMTAETQLPGWFFEVQFIVAGMRGMTETAVAIFKGLMQFFCPGLFLQALVTGKT